MFQPRLWSNIGQKRFLTKGGRYLPPPARKRFSREKLLDLQQLLGGIDRRPLVSDLRFVIGFATAHPAGTVDLPLGQPSSGTMFPSKNIFLFSKLAKNIFLAMDHSHALLTIVTAVSVQL